MSLIAFQNGMTLKNWTILGYFAIQGSIEGLEVWHLNTFFQMILWACYLIWNNAY